MKKGAKGYLGHLATLDITMNGNRLTFWSLAPVHYIWNSKIGHPKGQASTHEWVWALDAYGQMWRASVNILTGVVGMAESGWGSVQGERVAA